MPARHLARSPLALGAALVVATVAVYAQVRGHAFVHYDDDLVIFANPMLHAGLSREGIAGAFTGALGNWIPLTVLSLLTDYQLHGLEPAGYLLGNVALHAAAAAVLFAAFARMTQAPLASAAVAAVFALHPLHVESVAWAAMRKDALSGLCFAGTLLAYARYAERPAFGRYATLAGVHALGLMAKPTLVTVPFVLLLLDLWPLGRLVRAAPPAGTGARAPGGAEPAGAAALDPARLRRAVIEKVPLLALAAIASALTVAAQSAAGATVSIDRLPLGVRVANALVALVVYVGKALLPVGLAPFYPHPGAALPAWQPVVAGALLVAATALCARAWRRRPYLVVGWLWYLGMLVPAIGLVQVGSQALADRYTYLPLIGLSLLPIFGLRDLAAHRPGLRAPLQALALAWLLALGLVAHRQVSRWRDSETLFTHALAVTERNHVMSFNLGLLRAQQGRPADAVALYRDAVRFRPDYADAWNNLAWTLATQPALAGTPSRAAEAVAAAERAVSLRGPGDAASLDTLAVAQAAAGRLPEAAATADEAARRARASGDATLARDAAGRAALFRAGRAYVEGAGR